MDNEDPRSTYLRLALMEFQLSDGASSILFRNLRNKGLAYSFDVDWELFPPGIAYMQAVVEAVEPDKLDSVLGQLRSAILEAHEFVGEDYLRRRRKYLEYVSASSLRNMFDRAYADSYFMLKGLPFNMPGYVDELSTAYWDRGNYAVGNASIATAIIN